MTVTTASATTTTTPLEEGEPILLPTATKNTDDEMILDDGGPSAPPPLSSSPPSSDEPPVSLFRLPWELQVNWLSFLRAYDLSAVHQTCRYYSNPVLADAIVRHVSERVYTRELTQGFDQQPVLCGYGNRTRIVVEEGGCSGGDGGTSTSALTATQTGGGGGGGGDTVADNSSNNNKKKPGKKPDVNMNHNSNTNIGNSGEDNHRNYYTYEHLRNMELVVIARVLSRPEPSAGNRGYVVSKSWCKAALRWLEMREEQQKEQLLLQQQQQQAAAALKDKKNKQPNKKMSKKQRMRNRKLSDANPPWPNVNSDLLCEHQNLQYCLSKKSARARRRLLDMEAWKMLKKLYPDSNEIEASLGECVHCAYQIENDKQATQNRIEELKTKRKMPLNDPTVRQFYTRTRGVPIQALRNQHRPNTNHIIREEENEEEEGEDERKIPAAQSSSSSSSSSSICPLQDGLYYILPRAWCYGWRKYIKTGEGGIQTPGSAAACSPAAPAAAAAHHSGSPGHHHGCGGAGGGAAAAAVSAAATILPTTFPPPDSASLLCDAHRLPLLPPHLEAYLYGQASQLLAGGGNTNTSSGDTSSNVRSISESNINTSEDSTFASPPRRGSATVVPGQAPDPAILRALREAGLSAAEVNRQLSAMRIVEQQQQEQQRRRELQRQREAAAAAAPRASTRSEENNEALDRENHTVVEIVTCDELLALEKCWPGTSLFCLGFQVRSPSPSSLSASSEAFSSPRDAAGVVWSTAPCRECDATGRRASCSLSIKNRARGWVQKSAEKARAPASLEY